MAVDRLGVNSHSSDLVGPLLFASLPEPNFVTAPLLDLQALHKCVVMFQRGYGIRDDMSTSESE